MRFKHLLAAAFLLIVVMCTGFALWYIRPYMPMIATELAISAMVLIAVSTLSFVYVVVMAALALWHWQDGKRVANRANALVSVAEHGSYSILGNLYIPPASVHMAALAPPQSVVPQNVVQALPAPQQEPHGLDMPHLQPSQEFLLSQMEEDSLLVSPGIQQSNGQIVKVSIVDVPHLKIIGSTGFGKSCLAGALLDQATQLNSPEVLQLALLDLEHKTSRLFEDLPHVAELQVGKRRVSMVATTADEVAHHLGYLKTELDRRAALSEAEIDQEPVLLMYVEEMLSLQYEVIDPKLLSRMFADLTILAVRGRKYGMFLLACMQTDYSSQEMKVSQKMFRFRSAAAIDTTAARAAGFMNTDLVKENFSTGKPGQFVVEYPSFSDIVLAPQFNVKRLVAHKARVHPTFRERSEGVQPLPFRIVNRPSAPPEQDVNTSEQAWQADVQDVQKVEQVKALRAQQWGKIAIIEKVWNVKRGGSQSYKEAQAEYEQIIQRLEQGA